MTTDPDNDDTRIVARRGPQHEAPQVTPPRVPEHTPDPEPEAPTPDDDRTLIVDRRPVDDHTLIVDRRPVDDHTVVVQRRRRSAEPTPPSATGIVDAPGSSGAPEAPEAGAADYSDTRLSGRRVAPPGLVAPVDTALRQPEPPQVPSGSSVRYSARPAPVIVPRLTPTNAPESVALDPDRLALAAAAAQIRQQANDRAQRRRRFTLVGIIACTLAVLVAAAYAVAALAGW
ncbi:hypothetical protein GY21_00775 [Cryobacterium roopkundense]|uniref:Uncharacterized protein n=1 Tax=Cryobacterium roopkundense TaxID=1001240 RepID=A0A099JVZ9_9MICO|nr:hypothetical protein [Cryobacterium roopkundense]KGJ82336.1 hypothetical protein GY21_00775 [Cryobacterium roopkundense]MBB5639498.1 hypothetical protein [Cryobacterium roopkundense]